MPTGQACHSEQIVDDDLDLFSFTAFLESIIFSSSSRLEKSISYIHVERKVLLHRRRRLPIVDSTITCCCCVCFFFGFMESKGNARESMSSIKWISWSWEIVVFLSCGGEEPKHDDQLFLLLFSSFSAAASVVCVLDRLQFQLLLSRVDISSICYFFWSKNFFCLLFFCYFKLFVCALFFSFIINFESSA